MPDPRPKKIITKDLKSLARCFTETSINTLAGIAKSSESDAARVSAAIHLLDRGWGKPEQPHTGDVSQDIRITIRSIIEGTNGKVVEVVDQPKKIEP